MNPKASYALAHPVYDPQRQITRGHTTLVDKGVSAGLTVNIGQE